jgi:hypothetical protein
MSARGAAASKPRHIDVALIDGARVTAERPVVLTAKVLLDEERR